MPLADVLARVLDVVTPSTCGGCRLPGQGICRLCREALVAPRGPGCRRCGHPWAVETSSCSACPRGLDALRFACAYEYPAPVLIAALKDGRRRGLARDLAALTSEQVEAPPGGILVPVPLGPARRGERGFNQSGLIARELGRRWGLRVADVLVRAGAETRQRGAAAEARRRNVRGAFHVADGTVAPAAAWIVDDVCTTGATLSACAAALRRAGCGSVGAVCVSRVLR